MAELRYLEFRPGRWVKLVDGQVVGPATPEEAAAWRRELAEQIRIWEDIVQHGASAQPQPSGDASGRPAAGPQDRPHAQAPSTRSAVRNGAPSSAPVQTSEPDEAEMPLCVPDGLLLTIEDVRAARMASEPIARSLPPAVMRVEPAESAMVAVKRPAEEPAADTGVTPEPEALAPPETSSATEALPEPSPAAAEAQWPVEPAGGPEIEFTPLAARAAPQSVPEVAETIQEAELAPEPPAQEAEAESAPAVAPLFPIITVAEPVAKHVQATPELAPDLRAAEQAPEPEEEEAEAKPEPGPVEEATTEPDLEEEETEIEPGLAEAAPEAVDEESQAETEPELELAEAEAEPESAPAEEAPEDQALAAEVVEAPTECATAADEAEATESEAPLFMPGRRGSPAAQRRASKGRPAFSPPPGRAGQPYLWFAAPSADELLASVHAALSKYEQRFHQAAGAVLCHADDLPALEKAGLPVDVRLGKGVPARNFWVGPK